MWFPRLRRKHPEFVPHIDVLESDHQELVRLEPLVLGGSVEALREFVALLTTETFPLKLP